MLMTRPSPRKEVGGLLLIPGGRLREVLDGEISSTEPRYFPGQTYTLRKLLIAMTE